MGLIWLAVLATLALVCSPARVTAQAPAPVESETDLIERLTNLAPVLDSRRGDTKSVVMIWHVWGPDLGNPRAVCAYGAPDVRACTVSHDDVPLFIAVGQDILAYGPLHGPRLLRGDWRVANEDPQGKTGDISVHWQILNIGHSRAGIDLDLRSFVMRADRDRTVTRLGENRFVLTGRTVNGGLLEARIDLTNPARYSRLIARSADDTARFELETLVVDGTIRPDFFRFPSVQTKIHVAQATPVLLDNLGEIWRDVFVSSWSRIPLKYPAGRKQWETIVTHPPDWQRLEVEDAALAPTLKDILQDMGHP